MTLHRILLTLSTGWFSMKSTSTTMILKRIKFIHYRCFYELKGMAVYQKCSYQGTDIIDDAGKAIRKGTTEL